MWLVAVLESPSTAATSAVVAAGTRRLFSRPSASLAFIAAPSREIRRLATGAHPRPRESRVRRFDLASGRRRLVPYSRIGNLHAALERLRDLCARGPKHFDVSTRLCDEHAQVEYVPRLHSAAVDEGADLLSYRRREWIVRSEHRHQSVFGEHARGDGLDLG